MYDFKKRSDDAAYYCDPLSSTRTEFASQCNVNNILKKYTKNGINPFLITKDAKYGDFTNVPNHQEALELVMAAEDYFMQFPADIRARFANDPSNMISYLSDPNNHEEAASLGLIDHKLDSIQKNSPPSADTQTSEGGSNP